jgi:hypothetical protein
VNDWFVKVPSRLTIGHRVHIVADTQRDFEKRALVVPAGSAKAFWLSEAEVRELVKNSPSKGVDTPTM